MPVIIGTSGWQYRSWKGRFYPADVAQNRWLEFYAERFRIVEVNNTFYRLPPPETFAKWAARTPDDFIIAPKLSRYLTHVRRLRDPADAVERFLAAAAPLGSKMGPLLLQLPPNLPADPGLLDDTLACFPREVRVAVEFRHVSWFADVVRRVLERRGAALCLPDRRARVQSPLWQTAPWFYVRFHQGRASPRPCYGRAALRTWARRFEDWTDADIYAFFNNDPHCCAVRDAVELASGLTQRGVEVSRVPRRTEVMAA